jgi:protein-disulfide isomerase
MQWFKAFVLGCAILILAACNPKQSLMYNSITQISKDKEFAVFIFVSGDCPLCKNYRPFIASLPASLPKNWQVVTIRMDELGDDTLANRPFAALEVFDREKQLSTMFKATVTPQVFVLNKHSKILYSGAIDNYATALGQHRTVVTQNYLLDAINAIKLGKKVSVAQTDPIGCYIEE